MASTALPQPGREPGRRHSPETSRAHRRESSRAPLLRAVLGEVLRRERAQQARTLADVAASARVSMPYLSEIERGRKEASSEVLSAVCSALRVELSAVLSEAAGDLAARGRAHARAVRLREIRAERALGTRASITSIAPRAATPLSRADGPMHSPLCLAA
ncbi:MAG: transcriptional regulator, family [Pseudonocardiales bacterium]|nr:transcriptional regulator, family [Pseudonocardiales bacterium]